MTQRIRQIWLFVFVTLVAGGCGGDDGSGPTSADVDAVTVSPSTTSLTFFGETAALAASGTAAGAAVSGLGFDWSSSNTAVASVAASGEVTAVGNGTATITAKVKGGTASGSASVSVAQAVASVDVEEPAGAVVAGATLQLSVTAQDQGGAAIAAPALDWSSSDEAVATVNGSGLVTAVDAGTATITAAGGGTSDGVDVDVIRENFTPAADETVTGVIKADQVVIPAGVTVTASGPLTLDALGSITIDGTLEGDCVAVSLRGADDVTVTGRVANACSDASAAGETLALVGTGEMMLDGAEIRASGDLEISNDPALDDSGFEALRVSGGPARQGAGHPCDPDGPVQGVCFTIVNGATVYQGNVGGGAGPGPAADGDDGASPTNGADGRNVRLLVRGNAKFGGTTTIWGQDGGRGGDGTVSGNTDQSVTGGNGGAGGNIRVLVTGTLEYATNPTPPMGQSASNIIRSGAGGRGGDATATATLNPAFGAKGPGATATGGAAGAPGLVQVEALGGVNVATGGLTLEIGQLERGGNALATGAPGADATETMAAQAGGDAAAEGGAGAGGPDKQLVRRGNALGNPTIPDTPAGAGGNATAVPGKGGNGVEANKDGAKGGDATGKGGAGGDQLLRGIGAGADRIGDGGPGGEIIFRNGLGGMGWSDCKAGEPEAAGGAGGGGGNTLAASTQGTGGQGRAQGADGSATYDAFGNGGDGGAGTPPGAGGTKGTDGSPVAPKNGLPTSFQDGTPGAACAAIDVALSVSSISNGALAAGTYDVVATGVQSGTTEATIGVRLPNGGFKGLPGQFGAGPGQNIEIPVMGLPTPGGGAARLDIVDLCYINDAASSSNPGTIEVFDASDQSLGTKSYTGPVVASPPAGIDPQPAGNCVRISREEFETMAYVVVYGLGSGFLDLQMVGIIWLLVLSTLS